ncbi:MAG: sigma-54-dependent Fis family transcriptional regulator [Sedimentisphaerales bacterium]|nr:sigma-54-dependent Fis family transcriptional regulator [Sedimentisphaerales bacterium]
MDKEEYKIIAVDRKHDLARRLESLFLGKKAIITRESNLDRVLERFETQPFDVLILTNSVFGQGDLSGIELLELITNNSPSTQILFLVDSQNIRMAMDALRAGSYHYARLPISDEELLLLIETAISKRPVYGTNLLLKNQRSRVIFEKLIGRSDQMQYVFQQIRQAAATDIPVLLQGETGTGKDLAAQAIHEKSNRSKGPYIAVNLGALPTNLVASDLFGHERGSFTGATEKRQGKFEQAHSGTIFLDEIDTIDEKVEISLLRLIEHKRFHRIGGRKDIVSNARIITASNQNLARAVEEGRFREDLFYRLDVFCITLPPLRERLNDISLLIDEFLKRFNHIFRKTILGISPECMSLLEAYSWPGNVRELKNVIQRAVLVCPGEVLLPEHLPDRFKHAKRHRPVITFEIGTSLMDIEKEAVVRTLAANRNNRKKTAAMLGISRRALYNKLDKHKIN